MTEDEHLQRHFELCKRVYLRMLADGSWPWDELQDSQNSEDLLESNNKNNDI